MLLVTGSLAFDHIMDFPGKFGDHIMPDKLHILNVSFLVPRMQKGYGGTAGNIAYTLALLGLRPAIFSVIGKDFAPYKQFLEKSGVDTSLLRSTEDHYTSTAFAITDQDNNQIWGFYPGADELTEGLSVKRYFHAGPAARVSRSSLQNHPSGSRPVKLVAGGPLSRHPLDSLEFAIIAPHNPKAMLKHAKEYTDLHVPYLFDPGMQLRWLSGDDLEMAFRGATIIIGNDYEIAVMEKKMKIKNLHDHFGKDKIVITTLGEKGSTITAEGKSVHADAVKLENVVDPSGAGDAYRAGFVAGFLKKLPLQTCGQIGSLAAAYSVETYGTVTHRFTKKEFAERYYENFQEVLPI